MLAWGPHRRERHPPGLLTCWFQENCAILRELVTLRAQKSSLLGFSTHADYVLEMNMAKTSQTVATFLGNWPSSASRASESPLLCTLRWASQ